MSPAREGRDDGPAAARRDPADAPSRGGRMYLISCGGTGGHLAPGIALAEEMVARGQQVTLLISEKKIDARLIEKYPAFDFVRLPGAPLGLGPRALLRFVVQQTRGLLFSYGLVRRRRPAAIIGFGGFTSAAVMVVGAVSGVPVALHEANRVPGRAVRMMAPLARRVYLPVGVALGSARGDRVRFAGLPVRREIRRETRETACAAFQLDPARPVVVVLGGSQGATGLNDWARSEAPTFAATGVQLVCVTGPGKGGGETLALPGPDGRAVAVVYLPFCDRMATLLSAADVVVSRAGAGTIAELIRCQTPAILVPYPHAADNHQAANAEYFERQGGGIVLSQAEVPDRLTRAVRTLLADPERLLQLRAGLARADRSDPLPLIADDLERLASARSDTTPSGKRTVLA